jgi:hypothetical protein
VVFGEAYFLFDIVFELSIVGFVIPGGDSVGGEADYQIVRFVNCVQVLLHLDCFHCTTVLDVHLCFRHKRDLFIPEAFLGAL